MSPAKKLDERDIEDILALTPMQEGMLFHYLKDPGSDLYFEQLCLDISGEITNERFEKAWNFVVETNEMLRAVFRWEKVEKPIQIILKKHKIQPEYYDYSGMELSEKKKYLQKVRANDRRKKFDLMEVPLRVTLCKVAQDRYEMVFSSHHILYDGWSNGIILKEFFDAYDRLSKGNRLIKPRKTRFKEFVKWNRNLPVDMDKQEKFWRDYLKGVNNTGKEFSIRKRSLRGKAKKGAGNYRVKFSREMNRKLEVFVKRNKITSASLLYSAWGILLQRYNHCRDVVFAATMSGRSAKVRGIENIVGLFINTLPLRVQTHPGETTADFLSRMYYMLQKRGEFESGSPLNINEYLEEYYKGDLFDSVVVIENYPLVGISGRENRSLSVNSFSISGMTLYDLTVIVLKFDGIEVNFTYDKELFTEESLSRLSDQFTGIIDEMLNDPGKKVSEIGGNAAVEEDRKRLLIQVDRRADKSCEPGYTAPVNEVQEKLLDIWSDLLRIDKSGIGTNANFFEFGGHSLKANLLAERIHKTMNVKVPLAEIFRYPTIRELSRSIMASAQDRFVDITPVEEKEYYPLSPAQKRLYILQLVDLAGIAYNGPTILTLEGQIDKGRTAGAFKKLINRHESLRTSFDSRNEGLIQKIHETVSFEIENFDLAARNESAKNCEDIIGDFIRAFDLSQAPLFRVGVIKLHDIRHILMMDMHHIITDGASVEILSREFVRLYNGEELPLLRIRYKDFSQWQNRKIISGEMKKQEAYWLSRFKFKGKPPVFRLPLDYPRPVKRTYEGETLRFEIAPGEAEKLRELAGRENATVFMVTLAIFNILLYKITNHQDVVVGTITAGRRHVDLENIIGFFVNTLVLRNYPAGDKPFIEFLREVRDNTLDAFDNQDYQFDDLVEKLVVEREAGRNPLFDSLFAFISQNRDIRQPPHWEKTAEPREPGLKIRPYDGDVKNQSKFDLVFYGQDTGELLSFTVSFAVELFKKRTIEKFTEFFQLIVSAVNGNEWMQLKDIEFPRELRTAASRVYEAGQIEFEI